jgi:FKBP-type peptidyl-prolyl cis-trans isomerase SlyD
MIIEKNKVVSLTYELKIAGAEETVEKVTDGQPLVFIHGSGNMLPKFESNLAGLKTGDNFEFILACDDAYGQTSKEAIVELPKTVFEVDGKVDEDMLYLGNVVPMMDHSGNRFNGTIIEILPGAVKMDFNHPLAGQDLHFKGSVVEVREATQEELQHGHIHSGGCGGCGSHGEESNCNSGGCDSGGCCH